MRDAGATWREIADEVGLDWPTVKRYLSSDAASMAPSRRGTVARKIDALAPVVDAWLAADPRLKASVVHERLVAEHGFDGHYQRVELYVAEARERLAREGDAESGLNGLHRRFEVLAGAQAQVDWGDEGRVLLGSGVGKVYSLPMTLSYSRDPFCCLATSQELGTFFDCHRRGFAHFGGVPGAVVYDRTKTVVRRHVAPREAVPLHPEAAAVAAHYGFVIDVLVAWRLTGKGRVERQVAIVRDHVLVGREFGSVAELDGAFDQWVPIRRAQRHRTHGELIGVRAEVDRAALGPLPELPYLVCDRHLRRVGRDCLIGFEGSHYSVPARAGVDLRTCRSPPATRIRAPACATTGPVRTSTATPTTSSPPTWPPAPDPTMPISTQRPGMPMSMPCKRSRLEHRNYLARPTTMRSVASGVTVRLSVTLSARTETSRIDGETRASRRLAISSTGVRLDVHHDAVRPTVGLLIQVAADTYTLKELKAMLLRADLVQERYTTGTDNYSRHGMVHDRLLRARSLALQSDREAHDSLLTFVRILIEQKVPDPYSPRLGSPSCASHCSRTATS